MLRIWVSCVALALTGTAWAQRSSAPAPNQLRGYRSDAGTYRVVTVHSLTLRDKKRGKDLRIKVRCPVASTEQKDAGPWPLVVFSHGLGGSKDAFPDLCERLASHGYIVIAPSHADSAIERARNGEGITRDNAFDIRQMSAPARWERVADISFIIDMLGEIETRVPALRSTDGRGLIDRDRIAVAGHSAGAYTAQLIGGLKARDLVNPTGQPRPDPRVKAAVIISGQGVNQRLVIRDDAWDGVSIPWLVIAGSLDTVPITRETPESRRHPFEKARGQANGGPPVYLLWIEGATHGSYQGRGATRLRNESPTTDISVIAECVASTTLAFLDRYLKGDDAGQAYLTDNGIHQLSTGKATIHHK